MIYISKHLEIFTLKKKRTSLKSYNNGSRQLVERSINEKINGVSYQSWAAKSSAECLDGSHAL